jgi:16S rRNA (guanine527-N7)-methyltransferase
VENSRIAELLKPYLTGLVPLSLSGSHEAPSVLTQVQLNNISIYINMLLRWNSRINLTAIREPEEIVRRHFGESLFAARYLFPQVEDQVPVKIIDVGSGAGFPGLPIKLWFPQAHVTLIESNQKKATFLREVIRTLTLTGIDVFIDRAENYVGARADVVTLRAVEKFDAALPVAIGLAKPAGRLALLIGESQTKTAKDLEPSISWNEAVNLPGSLNRILLVGHANQIK